MCMFMNSDSHLTLAKIHDAVFPLHCLGDVAADNLKTTHSFSQSDTQHGGYMVVDTIVLHIYWVLTIHCQKWLE